MDRLKISWDRTPEKPEEIISTEYVEDKICIIKSLLSLYIKEGLLAVSFTPPVLSGKFYTYEIKFHHNDEKYIIIVWKGVRTGDGMPLLHGHLIIN